MFSFPAVVNERAARVVGALVASTLSLAWLTGAWPVIPVMALGFLLRVGWGPRYSPLARSAVALASHLWPERPTAGAPKRFAQAIGACFTVAASALAFAGQLDVAWALVGMIIVFASLEALAGFCMGCWVYAHLQRLGLIAPDACVDCGPR